MVRASPDSAAQGLIYEGAVQTLRRFQDEVNEVRADWNAASALKALMTCSPATY